MKRPTQNVRWRGLASSCKLGGMRVAVFNVKSYDREYLTLANSQLPEAQRHELVWLEPHLTLDTVALAVGAHRLCAYSQRDGVQRQVRFQPYEFVTLSLRQLRIGQSQVLTIVTFDVEHGNSHAAQFA